jgi:hypothetical protein
MENSQKKIDLEAQAGLELRDTSMRGLVRPENLVDVAILPGATACEHQGQHGKKYVQGVSFMAGLCTYRFRCKDHNNDKENQSESRKTASK